PDIHSSLFDSLSLLLFFFFTNTATTEIYTLSLHDALPISMIEGKLLRGKHSQAGCLGGHIPVLFDGRPCTCGAIGCAEAEASGWALPGIVRDWPRASASALSKYPNIGFKDLFVEATNGDDVA